MKLCSKGLNPPPLPSPASHHQKTWDVYRVSATFDTLLKQATDAVTRFCHLAASVKESVARLDALLLLSLGQCMDNSIV